MNYLNFSNNKFQHPAISPIKPSINADLLDTHLELLKIIKRYEFSDGWTLLIAPEKLPDKQILNSCSINLSKVLTVHKRYCKSAFELAKKAIFFDNCAVLVIWDDSISGLELELIRKQAHENGTALYLLNSDQTTYNEYIQTH
ncbi:hypothetical protein KO525_05970 [Psychrosphaera sp. B3R10]|uniref:Cell division inhibitor SulA n=1 Tax=Psychrosphaera algicola TaxID=3023714 RepID=A0ABT5FB37_9GAMM|nr:MULTISPECIES: hypothetical protein [unclassified Psychrosphaera]MBU2882242.1 hypothetical protein [Psychrosphaera sp. I2R16]MBU2988923.1 hypothetical protein [Psychrosphaera sp. B3R10]MDC2887842.1 hypothetical protein [Psychrosphaera sp. G1-22]MDO6717943.1 hypothetical protein [Psychrosphaera sp. 1_MG-2023]